MKIVDLSTEISRRHTISVLVHEDMVDVLSELDVISDFVQPYEVESHDSFSENTDETPVEIEDVSSGDPSSINIVLTKRGLVTLVTKGGVIQNLESEDLVWEIT
jgi:hypothetical protein